MADDVSQTYLAVGGVKASLNTIKTSLYLRSACPFLSTRRRLRISRRRRLHQVMSNAGNLCEAVPAVITSSRARAQSTMPTTRRVTTAATRSSKFGIGGPLDMLLSQGMTGMGGMGGDGNMKYD